MAALLTVGLTGSGKLPPKATFRIKKSRLKGKDDEFGRE